MLISLVPHLSYAASHQIIIDHSNDPNQKTHAYAAKLFWNKRDQIWQKKIVVYGNHADPEKNHAVYHYLKKLKVPQKAGTQDLYYKRFYKEGNCIHKTPLASWKPWVINFDKNTLGAYKPAAFRENWNCPDWGMGLNLLSIVSGQQAYSGKGLRLRYPKGVSGCLNSKQCINWKPKLDQEFTTLYYGYRFKFAKNFPFVKGGKLPGIGGGTANSNAKIPNGRDGWSVRIMWQQDGRLAQYVYHPDQQSHFGDLIPLDMPILTLGKWHTIQTRVTLNQAGKKNGVIKTWLDGKVVLNRYNMRFRFGNNLKINRLLFASFYGGHGAKWAPPHDTYAFIDDVRLSPRPIFYK